MIKLNLNKVKKLRKLKFDIYDEWKDNGIQIYNLKNIDDEYVFYYDETNNIRKFWFKNENRLNITNIDIAKNFVLGGVAHYKSEVDFDTKILKSNLKLPNTTNEIKLKHIAKSDFLSCINSEKLKVFLNWLVSQKLFMHYSTLNILYWSLIDILESIIPIELLVIHMELKTVFYELVKIDLNNFIRIMYKYEYPNIDREKANLFLDEILTFIKNNKQKFTLKYPLLIDKLEIVCRIIQNSKNKELRFIVDETSYVLIENLFIFYKRPICIFINSKHIFDEENSIEEIFNKYDFYFKDKKWENYEFQNSSHNDLIQISDVLIGLIGKLFEYINNTEFNELIELKKKLTITQLENLFKLKELFEKSDNQSTALTHSIVSLIERDKLVLLLKNVK